VQEKALKEFETFIAVLRAHGIDVTVIDDTPEPHTPDSVFPNNWISFHDDGSVLPLPYVCHEQAFGKKTTCAGSIKQKFNMLRKRSISAPTKKKMFFLEGTGSMVLDRENRIAYACLSPRTDKKYCRSSATK
jgi:hypothetical protein